MTVAELIGLAINASMFLIVFTLGLNATLDDMTSLFRQPGLLVRSLLSMNIIMLVFAVVVVVALPFDLPPAIKIALVTLAVSPVPPVLPLKQERAGGPSDYAIGLLTAAAVVAIVLVPATIEFLGLAFSIEMHMSAAGVAQIVLVSVVIPLLAGVAVHYFAPRFAVRIGRPVSTVATLLLLAALVPVLFIAWPAIWALIGSGLMIVLIVFTLVGLAAGHLLGGPNPDDRTVLALATATRHPGVAAAIATINFPDQKAVGAVVICHLLIGAIVSLPYVSWRKRAHAAGAPKARLSGRM